MRYPPDWPRIRQQILHRARHCCEKCGVENHRLGGRLPDGRFLPAQPLGEKLYGLQWPAPGEESWCDDGKAVARLRIIRIVLTIAHLDHTPENCAPENLRAWCQKCHLEYDAPHHKQTAYQTRREGKAVADMFDGATQ